MFEYRNVRIAARLSSYRWEGRSSCSKIRWRASAIGMLRAISSIVLMASAAPSIATDLCNIPESGRVEALPTRDVTIDDIVRLRDVRDFSVSPDGRFLAFEITAADPLANAYCTAWYLKRLDSNAVIWKSSTSSVTATLLEPFGYTRAPWALSVGTGHWWSPNGEQLLSLRPSTEGWELWTTDVASRTDRRVLSAGREIHKAGWLNDHQIFVELGVSRSERIAIEEAIARNGVVYEGDYTFMGFSPQRLESERIRATRDGLAPRPVILVDLKDEKQRPATSVESAVLSRPGPVREPHPKSSKVVYEKALVDGQGRSIVALFLDSKGRDPIRVSPESRTVRQWWWDESGQEIVFLVTEQGRSSLHRVDVRSRKVQAVWTSKQDVLLEHCSANMGASTLVCLMEQSTKPANLALIHPRSGELKVVTDLNPEFDRLRKGTVKRYEWENRYGDATYAYLVLPPDAKMDEPLPLVVTTYEAAGFLRGATGDEYPIFPLAARGIAVLAWSQVKAYARLDDWQDSTLTRMDFWSPADSIQEILRRLVSEGVADKARLGIGGLSYGSQVTDFLASRTRLFAAASASAAGWDPIVHVVADEKARRMLAHPSYEKILPEISMALNATSVYTPLLFQVPESEYIASLQTVIKLRELGKPAELVIYPGAGHIKQQPIHKKLVYERNLDWFLFWLKGVEDPGPEKAEQYKRWRPMKPVQEYVRSMNP